MEMKLGRLCKVFSHVGPSPGGAAAAADVLSAPIVSPDNTGRVPLEGMKTVCPEFGFFFSRQHIFVLLNFCAFFFNNSWEDLSLHNLSLGFSDRRKP